MKHLHIILYADPRTPKLRLDEVASYLESKCLAFTTEVREEFFQYWLGQLDSPYRDHIIDSIAHRLARSKIRNSNGRNPISDPLASEVDFERRKISDHYVTAFGNSYDAPKFLGICGELLGEHERSGAFAHIIFTNQILSYWHAPEREYRACTIISGGLSIISTTGIVERPTLASNAKPVLDQNENWLTYNDLRLTEIIKGYALQAAVAHLTGKPFCDDPGCRLFNSKTQNEILFSQMKSPYDLCPRHASFLHAFQRGGAEA